MDLPKGNISSAEEYMEFVQKFVSLLDKQMLIFEQSVNTDQSNLIELLRAMPALISLVNTVVYLRGQDGMFFDLQPSGLDRKALYGYEDDFELRLNKLIDLLMDSNIAGEYRQRLTNYFIESRTKGNPTYP